MSIILSTVTVTHGGRIPLTGRVCKKMNVKKGDKIQIWEIQNGIFAVAKVSPIELNVVKGAQMVVPKKETDATQEEAVDCYKGVEQSP